LGVMQSDVSAAMLKRVEELQRLAESIAEHHPYWPTLYFTLELLRRVLEKWHSDFTREELEELKWLVEKVADSVAKIQPKD